MMSFQPVMLVFFKGCNIWVTLGSIILSHLPSIFQSYPKHPDPSRSNRIDGPNPIPTIGLDRVNPFGTGHTNGSLGKDIIFMICPSIFPKKYLKHRSPQEVHNWMSRVILPQEVWGMKPYSSHTKSWSYEAPSRSS